MKSYFHLLVVVQGLFVSDNPCISVLSVSIVSISVAISNPLLMLVPRMFWKPKLGESISVLSLFQGVARCWDVDTVRVVFWWVVCESCLVSSLLWHFLCLVCYVAVHWYSIYFLLKS
jgi:hypothetical protein